MINEYETMLAPLKQNLMIMTCSAPKRMLIDFLLKYVLDKRRGFEQLNGLRVRTQSEFEKFCQFRYEYIYEMGEFWQKNDLTAIVMPIWPHCAIKCKNNGEMGTMLEYSIMWNMTGFPAGVLPITKV